MAALSGMDEVKEKITEIVARANYDKAHGKKGEGFSSHYVFTVHQEQVKLHLQEYLPDFVQKQNHCKKPVY